MIWLYVAIGGAFGAMARFGISALITPSPGKFPIATFTANVLGCLLMGIIYVLIVEKQTLNPNLRPLLMVGFLGAFTTFSSFSLEALGLWNGQHFVLAVVYAIATLLASLCAVWLGYTLCEKLIH